MLRITVYHLLPIDFDVLTIEEEDCCWYQWNIKVLYI